MGIEEVKTLSFGDNFLRAYLARELNELSQIKREKSFSHIRHRRHLIHEIRT
jgi:hypothetical protein